MRRPLVLLVALAGLVAVAVISGLLPARYFTPAYLHEVLDHLRALAGERPAAAAAAFALLYIVLAAASVPGAAFVLTPSAGAIFGFAEGIVLCSFASSIGALLAFLVVRYLFRDLVERHFLVATGLVNRGIDAEGAYYLFAMRLTPVFPYFVINVVMAVTRLPARTFYWVSQVGMLPGTAVFVNAGVQLGQVGSAADVLSPGLLLSLVLIGVFPLVARRIVALLGRRPA